MAELVAETLEPVELLAKRLFAAFMLLSVFALSPIGIDVVAADVDIVLASGSKDLLPLSVVLELEELAANVGAKVSLSDDAGIILVLGDVAVRDEYTVEAGAKTGAMVEDSLPVSNTRASTAAAAPMPESHNINFPCGFFLAGGTWMLWLSMVALSFSHNASGAGSW